MKRRSLPSVCVHGNGAPSACSQCIGADVRRVELDHRRNRVLVDGRVVEGRGIAVATDRNAAQITSSLRGARAGHRRQRS